MNSAVATIRTRDGLVILSVREKLDLDFETDKPAELPMLTEQDGPYEIVRTPLTWQTERQTETQKQLLPAWEALRSVQCLDGTVSACVRIVLRHTVPELSSDTALPLLPWEQTTRPARVTPTAAHPRAYQGTKYKPPKDKAPAAVDLRPYLCDTEGQARLLTSLNQAGLANDLRHTGADGEEALPLPFRLLLWPSLRDAAEPEVERFLALYWELALDRSPQLLAAIALLVTCQPTANTREWCGIIAQQPEEWQLTFTALLLVSEAYRVGASTLAPSVLPLFWEVQNGPCPVYRLFCLFQPLINGLDCEYIAAGFRLADQLQPDYPFRRFENSGYFPAETAVGLMAHLKDAGNYYDRLVMTVWEHCGRLSGLGELLEKIPWTKYTLDLAYRYLHLFLDRTYDDLPDQWQWVRDHASQIDTFLQSVPAEYQGKCVSHIRDLLWFFATSPKMQRHMPSALALLQRLCRPPYKQICDTTYVTSDLLAFLPDAALRRFLTAPDTSFQRLEEACRLENNARLIGYGTWVLTPRLPDFVIECFLHYPAKFCKVAKRLGGLPEEVRGQVIQEFAQSSLMDAGLTQQELADADEVIQRCRQESVFNPVPRKLQEHLAGGRVLNAAQIAMYREQMNRQLSLTRLETLERAALAALQGHFTADPAEASVGHALTLYHSAKENRRALKKFLAAHWDGDDDYRMRHPLTQTWLKKHPQIDVATWHQGIVFQAESISHGPLTLSVEQEPLEAMKLGTYVGSCLGVGGGLMYSAVAAVLDINKQVVYARDNRGTVVARQLLALSEQNQLVCFSVYPLSVPEDILRMFAGYDRRFAESLNISFYNPETDEEYDIDMVLSHRWWDDMAWDLQSNAPSDKGNA